MSNEQENKILGLKFIQEVKAAFSDEPEKYRKYRQYMKEIKDLEVTDPEEIKKLFVSIRARMAELLEGHEGLLRSYDSYMATVSKVVVPKRAAKEENKDEIITARKKHGFPEAVDLINRIRLRDEHVLKKFRDASLLYREGVRTPNEFCVDIAGILEGHDDLFQEFRKFVPDSEARELSNLASKTSQSPVSDAKNNKALANPESEQSKQDPGKKRSSRPEVEDEFYGLNFDDDDAIKGLLGQGLRLCQKVREQVQCCSTRRIFYKQLYSYAIWEIRRSEMIKNVGDLLGKCDGVMDELNAFLNNGSLAVSPKQKHKRQKLEDKKQSKLFKIKSINLDLSFSGSENCGPSYQLLPEDRRMDSARNRTALCSEVLNDKWVSKPAETKDSCFKTRALSEDEKAYFKCEDDMYHLDMFMSTVSSTSSRVEQLLRSISKGKNRMDSPINIAGQFTAPQLRCIKRICDEELCLEMEEEVLHQDPVRALSVILNSLKLKKDELGNKRSELGRFWASIFHVKR